VLDNIHLPDDDFADLIAQSAGGVTEPADKLAHFVGLEYFLLFVCHS
jgi:hypothetical protein